MAFRFAIEKINDDATILPGVTLVAHVERVSVYNSVSLEKKGKHLKPYSSPTDA